MSPGSGCCHQVDRVRTLNNRSTAIAPTRARFLVMFVCVGQFLIFYDRFLLAAVAPMIQRDLSLTDWQIGVLLGPAFALAFCGTAVVCSQFASRNGRRRSLTIGLLVWGVAAIAIAFASSFASMAIARISLGIGQAVFMPIAITLLVDTAPIARRGVALALFTGSSTTGRGLALLTAGAILAILAREGVSADGVVAWRILLVITGLPTLLLVAAARIVPVTTSPQKPDRRRDASVAEWLRTHRSAVANAALIAVAPVVAVQTLSLWMPIMLTRAFSVPLGTLSAALGGITLVTAPAGHLIGGQLVDRVDAWRRSPGRLVVLAMVLALPVVCIAAITEQFGAALLAIAVLNVLLGIATIAGLTGMQNVSSALVRESVNGYFLAFTTLVGVGIGPALAGLLSGLEHGDGRLGIALALVVVTALSTALASMTLVYGRRSLATIAVEARGLE